MPAILYPFQYVAQHISQTVLVFCKIPNRCGIYIATQTFRQRPTGITNESSFLSQAIGILALLILRIETRRRSARPRGVFPFDSTSLGKRYRLSDRSNNQATYASASSHDTHYRMIVVLLKTRIVSMMFRCWSRFIAFCHTD